MKWNYKKDIHYSSIDTSMVKKDEFLFYLITFASFIEIASDAYSTTLSQYFADNDEAVLWLNSEWEQEEIQHGEALKKYVQTVWVDFDWQSAYEQFLADYLPLCNLSNLQPTKAKEMLARMIIETGTSTFYKAMEVYANEIHEPVLAQIAHNIYKDEIKHYSYFNQYFTLYNKEEKNGRAKIVQVIYQRLKEADTEDIFLAYKAIYTTLHKGAFEQKAFDDYKSDFTLYAKKYYPYSMGIKMLLHPLHLTKNIQTAMIPTIKGAIRILGF